ncbi:MAG: hypothetical protein A3H35_16800 [Betaproteobacteria bacterium RIFCSPLOWO2_02_FULL_62_17]|nr:MAG: hypothetical protein A3H35_16800 [Betaproteobacteria bacterium RIFCSPLOWO2_02_FULL_62_17]
MEKLVPFIPWLGGALAFVCLFAALRNNRRKRLIESLPTSKTAGVFIGLVELKGTAESEAPLTSYFAEVSCVHYEWVVEEHWQRTTTETSTDADGKRKTETRTESGWKSVAWGGETQSFYLKDSEGVVLVHSKGARLDPESVFSRSSTPGDPLYYGKCPAGEISDSTHQRRFTERAFRLHAPVFVVGKARERRDVVAAEIAQDDSAELFLISSQSEEKVTQGFRNAAWLWTAVGLLVLIGSLLWWDAANARALDVRTWIYASAALAYLGVFMAGWVWTVFNSLIALRNRVLQGWALVDVQLKRRHDLIPKLVQIVSGLKDHERRVQTQVATLREQLAATPPGKPGVDPQALRPTLVGLQEAYPVLKSYDAFLSLQRNLADTENRIALARDYFNSIATHHNTRLEQIPDRFVAAIGAIKPHPLLAAQDFERAAVNVEFAR